MANNKHERDQLALQTYGFSLDKSQMKDGSIASNRGSTKNKSMITYYETIPEFGGTRNRFMNKTLVTHGAHGKRKVSVTANQVSRNFLPDLSPKGSKSSNKKYSKLKGKRLKSNMRGHSDFMNQTPKAKRSDAPYFGHRNNSVAHTVLKPDRMQESERIQSQTLDYNDR